jgi:hypothetical protein
MLHWKTQTAKRTSKAVEAASCMRESGTASSLHLDVDVRSKQLIYNLHEEQTVNL